MSYDRKDKEDIVQVETRPTLVEEPLHTSKRVTEKTVYNVRAFTYLCEVLKAGGTICCSARIGHSKMEQSFSKALLCAIMRPVLMAVSIFTALLCIVLAGYDSSLMTALIAMTPFQQTFHSETTGTTVAVMFSMMTVGSACASPFGPWIADTYGRRACMATGAVVVLVGMAITSSSSTVAQITVGRFVLGFGGGISTIASGPYVIEVAPPHWRGRCGGLYMTGWFWGAIPAAAVCFGTNYLGNNFAWRIPLILQGVASGLICVLIWFIPESPRFLMMRGRQEEAFDFLVKYHGNGDPNSKLVALEMHEMSSGIRTDGSDKRWWDYRPIFVTHAGRWRMTQVVMMSIAGQFSGNGLGYFNTVIYNNLGVTSVPQQLGYNLMSQILSLITVGFSASFTDKVPRRKILVVGTTIMAVLLAINAGLSAALDKELSSAGGVSHSLGQGALAAYFLFGIAFAATYTPLQAVIPAEAMETTIRAKGLALSGIVISIFSFINQFAGPIALGNIRYRYIYIFVAWDLLEAAAWYFFGVEAQGRTVEELAYIYDQPNPVKASLHFDKVLVTDSGHVAEVL